MPWQALLALLVCQHDITVHANHLKAAKESRELISLDMGAPPCQHAMTCLFSRFSHPLTFLTGHSMSFGTNADADRCRRDHDPFQGLYCGKEHALHRETVEASACSICRHVSVLS